MDWTTHGKTVFITGAARGLGAETARRVAARGANVALVGLEPEELERVAAQCGTNAATFECDVTDVQALEAAVNGALDRFGGIDVVMANAGIAPMGMTRSMDPMAFERTIEINLLGVWRTVRACLPHVIERQGYVYITASMAAAGHAPGMAAYAASKAGVEAFADSLRGELNHLGVDVGVGYFGFIDTDMVRGADAHPVLGKLRDNITGPLSKTYPLSMAGKAIADGIEGRKRWIVVPPWARALIVARTVFQPLIERQSREHAAEADALFMRDVEERGAAVASGPVGPGGIAALTVQPETPRGGEADKVSTELTDDGDGDEPAAETVQRATVAESSDG
jgi:NAD(P)-dependent dehydrogenase (short-subunit alcohol dehydrogenase family)